MANPTNLPGDLIVPGDVRISGSITPGMTKSKVLAEASLQPFPIPLTSFRKYNDMAALPPSAGTSDHLALIEGTHGTDTPTLQTEDLVGAGASNEFTRFLVQLPWNYIAGQSVSLRFMTGYITTAPSVTGTLDCEAYKQEDDPDDSIGSDLCTTSAADIKSTTFAAKTFVITGTSLSPGDILDVMLTIATNDGGATECIGAISWAHLLCDVR